MSAVKTEGQVAIDLLEDKNKNQSSKSCQQEKSYSQKHSSTVVEDLSPLVLLCLIGGD
jgi:hypothetical protein